MAAGPCCFQRGSQSALTLLGIIGVLLGRIGDGSAASTTDEELPLALASLPEEELRDIDCERVRSALVDWLGLRDKVQQAEKDWQAPESLPRLSCAELLDTEKYSDALIVMARAMDAAAECVLGTVATLLVLLICTAECPGSGGQQAHLLFEQVWRLALVGQRALPPYMLGTSQWPIAALLAKWQAHCRWMQPDANRPVTSYGDAQLCDVQEARAFSEASQRISDEELRPLLYQQGRPPEHALGYFATRVFRPLTVFLNSGTAALANLAELCPGAAAAQAAILLLFRLLGPPVPHDPLNPPRLAALAAAMANLSLVDLVAAGEAVPWPTTTILAAAWHLSWRSHRIFREVPLGEVRAVLSMGAKVLRQRRPERPFPARWPGSRLLEGLRSDVVARRRLWQKTAAASNLGDLWHQVSRWLLAGEPSLVCQGASSGSTTWTTSPACSRGKASAKRLQAVTPLSSPVFLTMGFGNLGDVWVEKFLDRALEVRIQRLIFVTPDRSMLLACERLRHRWQAHGSLLCVRAFTPSSRPYDHNNKAKFFLFPILLSLGMDIGWLDIDIFLFKDPARRLVEQAYQKGPNQPKDVIVTDHFDEYCLNHGVFMVRASDRSLLWILRYIEWMHWYPFGHDQNGWDAFLDHSIAEPQRPPNLRTDAAINVSYGLLDTQAEYATLTGWSGQFRSEALLLHFTTTQGITFQEKRRQLFNLFNATRRRPSEDAPDERRLRMATWKVLNRIRTGRPMYKRPCYEGIHMAIGRLLEAGHYDELLA